MLYPIGIQNFEKLRDGDYIYVDKTDKLYNLVNQGGYYFLSRPRRFGKSLLVSTLEAYLQGKKELFKGLAIESLEKNWTEYPVLHIDLSGVTYDEEEVLPKVLGQKLSEWETAYGVTGTADIIGLRFQSVIKAAYEKMLLDDEEPTVLHNNCSGKHIMMLGLCVMHNWDLDTYTESYHPLQKLIKERIYELWRGGNKGRERQGDCPKHLYLSSANGKQRAFWNLCGNLFGKIFK